MFSSDETPDRSARWFVLLAGQSIALFLGSIFVTYLTSGLMASFRGPVHEFGFEDVIANYGVLAIFAFICGVMIGGRNFSLRESGSVVFIIPLCLLTLALLNDSRGGVDRAFRTYFIYEPGNGDSESGLGLVLLTLPTLTCCAYSAGIRFKRPRGSE